MHTYNAEKQLTQINDKFILGDAITDEELKELLNFYEDLEKKIKLLGPTFHFCWREILDRKIRLESYKIARERKYKINS